jgi:hypothetical protein
VNIPVEIVAAILATVLAGCLTGMGFIFNSLRKIGERLARLEEHLGVINARKERKQSYGPTYPSGYPRNRPGYAGGNSPNYPR